MVKIVCGQMEEFPVEQIHFFLAKDGSLPGLARNDLTLKLLWQELVANGVRTIQKGKHMGMFNYLEQVVEAVRVMAPHVFKPPDELEMINPKYSDTFALKMLQVHGEITSENKQPGHLRFWAQMESDVEGDAPARPLLFIPRGLQQPYQDEDHAGAFQDNCAPVGDFPPFQTYRRVAAQDERNEVEQRRWILQVPGFEKVCETPCPDNDDIQLIPGANGQMSTMEVTLTKKKAPNNEPDWSLHDAPGSSPPDDATSNHTQNYAFPVDFVFKDFDFYQEEGLLVITVQGVPRRKQQYRKTTAAVSVRAGR